MQSIKNFFYGTPAAVSTEPPAPIATKPRDISSEKELLEKVEECVKAALANQETSLTFLPKSQEHTSYSVRFGYQETGAEQLPSMSHSFIIETTKPVEQNSKNYCSRTIRSDEGQAFYKTEGNFQKWLTPATVDKIDEIIRTKLKEMNPSNDFGTKKEMSDALEKTLKDSELQFRKIREALLKDPLFAPSHRRLWLV